MFKVWQDDLSFGQPQINAWFVLGRLTKLVAFSSPGYQRIRLDDSGRLVKSNEAGHRC